MMKFKLVDFKMQLVWAGKFNCRSNYFNSRK
jgi:hypothetical protein